ncbi:hypothetical protein B0H11DRAFT_1945070 [Mycena galericulata]|nr:hypothetical protein B0H11DRAFT_1945070 [Mycena galericulata]
MSSLAELTSAAPAKPKTKRRRGKGGKRGKKSWVSGTKLAFFERRKEDWRLAVQGDSAGAFYSHVSKLFISKYGWHFDLATDLEEDSEDPDDDTADMIYDDEDDQEDEENEARFEYYTDLRTKVGQWYRYHYRKITGAENFASLFAEGEGVGPKPPRVKRVLHVYSAHYYATRVKASYEKEWTRVTGLLVEGEEKPHKVNVRNGVTKKCWEAETAEFRKMVEDLRDRENKEAREKWEAEQEREVSERTAEDYDQALRNAAVTLQPFADAASKRYGMAVSILLVGPVGAKGGAIEVRSVHAGTTRGSNQKSWPLADADGFKTVVNTMLRFGILAYSQEQCDARAVTGATANAPTVTRATLPTSAPPVTPSLVASASTAPSVTTLLVPAGTPAPELVAANGSSVGAPKKPAVKAKEKAGPAKKGRGKQHGGAKEVVLGPQPERPRPRPLGRKGPSGAAAGTTLEAPDAGGADDVPPDAPDARGNAGVGGGDDGGDDIPPDARGNAGIGGDSGGDDIPPDAPDARGDAGTSDGGKEGGDGEQQQEEEEETPAPSWAPRTQSRWPEECQKLYRAMEKFGTSWGPEWEALADAYVAFEEACGFPYERVSMEKKGRVPLIDRWMKMNRPYNFTLALREEESVELLADQWWSWWKNLQPPERIREDGGLARPMTLDWGNVRDHAGRNGMGLVVLVLLWWGLYGRVQGPKGPVAGTAQAMADWGVAVEEATWALESLVKMGGLSKKRAAERGISDKQERKKRALMM